MEISIHAPPRGATFQRCSVGDEWKISIHAPPRGATRCNQLRKRKNRAISIHAPPRGATFAPPRFSIRARFQFTPLREGRHFAPPRFSIRARFQFTPLREGRHEHFLQSGKSGTISIHAPPRGATTSPDTTTGRDNHISIHAPPRGATSETGRYQAGEIISIHAPPRGATRRALRLRMQPNDFNSRPSARGDHKPRHHNWEG